MTRAPIAVLMCLLTGASARGAEWKEQPLPANGRPGDQLGASVAVGKDVIAVGAYLSDAGGKDSGSVYLFNRGLDGSWVLFTQLHGAPGEWFGFDVAIDAAGTVLIVGAPNPGRGAGAVYAVDLDSGEGTAVRRPGALLQGAQKGDELGSSVAIDGNRVAAGARGADRRAGRAYVVEPSGATRTIVSPNSKAGRELGQSVSLSGNFLVVGEPLPGEDRRSPGAAYLFDLGSEGNPIELKPSSELAAGSAYGYAVAVRNRRVLIGAPLSGSQAGAVYGFDCEGACAPQPLRFEARRGDQLGVAVAMSGNTAVVGARGARSKAGAAFPHTWGSASLGAALPHSPASGAEFGFAAAIHEDVMVVGAFKQGGGGAAYVFEPEEVEPPQTITLSLSPAARRVREGTAALVEVMLRTSDGAAAAKPFAMTVSTQNGTALAPGDYKAASMTRELSQARPGKILSVRIPTVGDSVLEADETFKVVLASSTAGVVVQGPAEVTIVDDDCVQLSLSPMSVNEGEPPVLFNVHLPQASASAVRLIFTSTNPSVTVGPSVTFPPGDQDATVAVSGDDAICNEEPPSFTVRVTAVSGDPDFACIQEDLTVTLTGDDDLCVEVLSSVCTSGGTVLYTWEIANTGNLPLPGVGGPEISEQLPEEITVVAASADSGAATVDYVENEMAWNGSIPPGTSATIQTLAALEPGVTPGTDLGFEAIYRYAGGETAFEVPFVVGEAAICPPPLIE
ncbi:MAG TPA: Calx-beta domain-containing protein [Thermoanaerobaculia bacterium]|nr:Calx-beta domain-containing protein [Thermoanaerobaculia bacterium]